jgi:hypothetical protein
MNDGLDPFSAAHLQESVDIADAALSCPFGKTWCHIENFRSWRSEVVCESGMPRVLQGGR